MATPYLVLYVGCHTETSGATRVLPAPMSVFAPPVGAAALDDAAPAALLLLLLDEPQAATPNETATNKHTALIRPNRTIISFIGYGSSVGRTSPAGVIEL